MKISTMQPRGRALGQDSSSTRRGQASVLDSPCIAERAPKLCPSDVRICVHVLIDIWLFYPKKALTHFSMATPGKRMLHYTGWG